MALMEEYYTIKLNQHAIPPPVVGYIISVLFCNHAHQSNPKKKYIEPVKGTSE
jgi:hypothetical protein